MERVDDKSIDDLLQIIQGYQHYPTAAEQALATGKKLLQESDKGLIQMEKEVRERLKQVLAEWEAHLAGTG